eukprot:jgi/Bigna1/69185/fgenesh1_pg.8_\
MKLFSRSVLSREASFSLTVHTTTAVAVTNREGKRQTLRDLRDTSASQSKEVQIKKSAGMGGGRDTLNMDSKGRHSKSASFSNNRKICVPKDVPAPFRVSIFDLVSGAVNEDIDPLECETEMEITSTVMLALGLPGHEHLRSSPRLQLFEYIVQPGVVLAVLMYLLLTRFLYGMVPAWRCLWRWMLWGGIYSQLGPMYHLLSRCKRTEYGAPQQMDLIFFGYLVHNSPPSHHCVRVCGASIEEANGVYVREGARDGAPQYIRRIKDSDWQTTMSTSMLRPFCMVLSGKQYCICRRTRRRPEKQGAGLQGHQRSGGSNANSSRASGFMESKWWITQVDAAGIKAEKRYYAAIAENTGYCPPETGWTSSRGQNSQVPRVKSHTQGPVGYDRGDTGSIWSCFGSVKAPTLYNIACNVCMARGGGNARFAKIVTNKL